ncbi:MAG TPA: RHS repeat-associated core domain-containing protein [Thermoanaerobaculia bacterium]|jgi:RHS repeat-associated protein|nr:RHS repeat-associated core domain-containing protein [Thermoanaerobaculia bacterium]
MATLTAGAAEKEQFEPGTGKYVVVLKDGRTEIVDEKTGKKKATEPDVAKLGGEVLHKKDNTRIVKLSVEAANELRKEENVAYVQRVWMGESLENWDEREEASDRRHKYETDSETDLTWSTGQYFYDGSGNVKKIGDNTYTYDSAGRLIKAVVSGATETYKYDSFGNLTEKALGATPAVIGVDSSSNRLSGESYDAAGNLTTRRGQAAYQYDSMGMMDQIVTPLNATRRMIYGPDDERIGVILDPGLSRWKIRDFNGKVLREFSGAVGGSWVWVEDYVYGEGRLIGGERESYYGGKLHFHTDHLGSVRMVTTQARKRLSSHEFYPFGTEKTPFIQEDTAHNQRPESMKFTGHERDFHGLLNVENTDYIDYMHARYYDPNMGRFLSVDPVFPPDQTNPQSLNRYAYVENNPINASDPTGMIIIWGNPRPPGPGHISDAQRWFDTTQEIGLDFLKVSTGYNFAVGSFSYFRGIYRFDQFRNRALGLYGQEEMGRVYTEVTIVAELVRRVPPIAAYIRKHGGDISAAIEDCMGDSVCLTTLIAVANEVSAKVSTTENQQRFAGRFATGAAISYLTRRAGGGRSGMLLGTAAGIGDATWKISKGARTLEDILEAVLAGK